MKLPSRQGPLKIMLCLLSSMSAPGYSQEQGNGNSSPVADAEAEFLFINMIEFLGEFETDTGEWISPDILGNDAFADLDAGNGDTGNREGRGERVLSATGNDDEE